LGCVPKIVLGAAQAPDLGEKSGSRRRFGSNFPKWQRNRLDQHNLRDTTKDLLPARYSGLE
jgi:hypothetical protein